MKFIENTNTFLAPLKLQLFAEEPIEVDVPPVEDEEQFDVFTDDEDVEDEEDDVEDEPVEEVEDEEIDDVPEEETDEEDEVAQTTKPTFDKKQQKELDRIVKSRLERQERTLIKELRDVAGTEIEMTEVTNATRLWGLLKTNPNLSRAVDQLIDQQLQAGQAKAPTEKTISQKEIDLEVREAVLDLKQSDKVFNKHSDKIMNWAEEQGFDVTNKKSLNLAYLAWKGSQENLISATKKVSEQKKQATKQAVRQKAKVQSGKSSKAKANIDYAKLSDADVLSSLGVNLFTDD